MLSTGVFIRTSQRENNNIRFVNNTCFIIENNKCFIIELGFRITKTRDTEHGCRNMAQREMENYNP